LVVIAASFDVCLFLYCFCHVTSASRSKLSTRKSSTTLTKTKQTTPTKNNDTKSKIVEPIVGEEQKEEINPPNINARLGLARLLVKQQDSSRPADVQKDDEIESLYRDVIKMAPDLHDAYIELGEILAKVKPADAIDVFCRFPFQSSSAAVGSFDDGYLYGEIVRLLMKEERFEDERLKEYKYNKLLREVYAGVNRKSVDDPDLKAFFKFKCWE